MTSSGRRLSPRHRLQHPVEAALGLCGGQTVRGWIVDEQDDGVGMAFGGDDVLRMLGHQHCCRGAATALWLEDGESSSVRPIPMRLAHVTPTADGRTCRAGLAFDVRRMEPQDIVHLLGVWRRLVPARGPEPE